MISALRKHLLYVFFLIVQIFVGCVVLSNVIFMMVQLSAPLIMPDGLHRGSLVFAQAVGSPDGFTRNNLSSLLYTLKALPGVRNVSEGLGLPYWSSAPEVQLSFVSGPNAALNVQGYLGNGIASAFKSHFVAGRDFSADELAGNEKDAFHSSVVLSQQLADRLFPDGNAVGRSIRAGSGSDFSEVRVVGVVDHLVSPSVITDAEPGFSFILPGWPSDSNYLNVILRVDAPSRERVIKDLPKILSESLPSADRNVNVVDSSGKQFTVMSDNEARGNYFQNSRSLVLLLSTIVAVVCAISIYGISSLTSAWIHQRRRSIGIRRALGGTKLDIVRYFLCENLLIVSIGLVLGVVCSYIFNAWMMKIAEVGHLPIVYVMTSSLLLIVIGQLSVLPAALRNSSTGIISHIV